MVKPGFVDCNGITSSLPLPSFPRTILPICLFAALAIASLCLPLALAHDESGHAKTLENLGDVRFETSCDSASHEQFEIGVALLHSYGFAEALKAFNSALEKDPRCAMAYWGIATALLGDTLSEAPPAKDLADGAEALAKARALGAKTQRERDWIDAIGVYYRDHDLRAYEKALQHLSRRYPDDFEAKVFHALALQATAPKRDQTYANQIESAAVLEALFARNPRHPGVSHYLIHAYDHPRLAERGLTAARRYASIAPAAPHALHMPSRIYAKLGLWKESIAANISALEAQHDDYPARDWLVYAYLQLAQDNRARALADHIASLQRDGRWAKAIGAGSLEVHMAVSAIPARYVLERADWKAAAALPIVSSAYPQADALVRFARGLGMARSGDLPGAKAEIAALKAQRQSLINARQPYWAARTEEKALAVSAWVAYAKGANDRALELMRAAADLEDGSIRHVAMENRLYPLRELLGELLLEMGQAAPALREFEAALAEDPNRFQGLHGAAHAAEASQDPRKAAQYYKQLRELTRDADTPWIFRLPGEGRGPITSPRAISSATAPTPGIHPRS